MNASRSDSRVSVSLRFSGSRFPIDSPLLRLTLRASFAVRSGILPAQSDSRLRQGFTLIELLVVVVIIGVLVVALTLSVGGSGERQLGNEAERFQALLGHACSQAELGGREIGVVLAADSYAFRRLDGSEWSDIGTDELRTRRWLNGLRMDLSRDGRPIELATPKHDVPQVVCFSSGELTPFVLTLALGDLPARYRVTGKDDGSLKLDRLAASP